MNDAVVQDPVLDLVKQKGEVVYLRSGKNHPWRKSNIFAKTLPSIGNDPFFEERNMRWWNNFQPNLDPFLVKILKELEEYHHPKEASNALAERTPRKKKVS